MISVTLAGNGAASWIGLGRRTLTRLKAQAQLAGLKYLYKRIVFGTVTITVIYQVISDINLSTIDIVVAQNAAYVWLTTTPTIKTFSVDGTLLFTSDPLPATIKLLGMSQDGSTVFAHDDGFPAVTLYVFIGTRLASTILLPPNVAPAGYDPSFGNSDPFFRVSPAISPDGTRMVAFMTDGLLVYQSGVASWVDTTALFANTAVGAGGATDITLPANSPDASRVCIGKNLTDMTGGFVITGMRYELWEITAAGVAIRESRTFRQLTNPGVGYARNNALISEYSTFNGSFVFLDECMDVNGVLRVTGLVDIVPIGPWFASTDASKIVGAELHYFTPSGLIPLCVSANGAAYAYFIFGPGVSVDIEGVTVPVVGLTLDPVGSTVTNGPTITNIVFGDDGLTIRTTKGSNQKIYTLQRDVNGVPVNYILTQTIVIAMGSGSQDNKYNKPKPG